MIAGYSSPSYAGTFGVDLVLFLAAIPFGVCDLYYSFRDYSCVWIDIANSSIKFPLQLWLRVDGGVLLGMATLILLFGLVLYCNPVGCEGLFWFHNVLTFVFALFRVAWLVIGSIMFWGYLNRYNLCDAGIRRYMWANLIIGFVLSILYFLLPCLCGCFGKSSGLGLSPGMGMGMGMGGVGMYGPGGYGSTGYNGNGGYGTGTNLGFGTSAGMGIPLPPVTPSIRSTTQIK